MDCEGALIKFLLDKKLPAFPLAIASNLFSVTALLIFFGVTGNSELAAEVGIIQGATLTTFLAFSGNARNLILGKSSDISFGQLVRFRTLFVFPFGLLAYFLCLSFIEVSGFFVIALTLRRCTEWLAELIITERECQEDYSFAGKYVFLQAASFSTLLLRDTVSTEVYSTFFLFWAITPILFGGKNLLPSLTALNNEKMYPGIKYIFHIGSSWVIATTTFVFRIMVIALTSKLIGGELFTAFAIGGMLNSIYTYVIGPSLISKETKKSKKTFKVVLISCTVLGIAIIFLSEIISTILVSNVLFFQALGFSLVGSAIMMISQRQRMVLLQIQQESVFVPDVLTNVLIISIIPLFFYIAGTKALGTLFFCSACLTYIFYSLPINIKKEM